MENPLSEFLTFRLEGGDFQWRAVQELFGDAISVDVAEKAVLVNYVFAVYDVREIEQIVEFHLGRRRGDG